MNYEEALKAIEKDLAMYERLRKKTKYENYYFSQDAAFGSFTFWRTLACTDSRFQKDSETKV